VTCDLLQMSPKPIELSLSAFEMAYAEGYARLDNRKNICFHS